ncbi:MAG: hypothetical protein FJY85_13950 [Deltaproteobacteria bacterium]|nr:hypothetical protein [Deltaproteobacteria bacterium]
MIILDRRVEDALTSGMIRQVIVADSDGFVLDHKGQVYDPDELVSVFMSTQRLMEEGATRLAFGQVIEFGFRLVGTDMAIACRRVFSPEGGCLVIVIVPIGTAHNVIITDIVRRFAKYVEEQRASLRKS